MLLVLLPCFSSFFHIPSTCFTHCIHASLPSCWTNSACLHTLKLPFLKAFSSCFPLSSELFLALFPWPVFCGLSQVRDQPAEDGLAQDGLFSQPRGTTGQVLLQGALPCCCQPSRLALGQDHQLHTQGREGALLLDPGKTRNVVRDDAVDYPSPADTRAESQAPISRFILSVLALL